VLRKVQLSCIGLLLAWYGLAQAITQPVGARYPTLGAYSTQVVDVFSTRNNVAAMASLKQSAAGAYGERRYMLDDLNLFAASGALLTRSGNFGLHAGYAGGNGLSQTQFTLNYGRKINRLVDVGAGFHYLQLTQPSFYGNAAAITASFGVMLHLTDKVHTGFSAYNPLRSAWSGDKDARLPARYGFGFGFDASDKLFLGAVLIMEESQPVDVQLGLQYAIIPQLFFRGGFATQNSSYYVGLGWQLSGFRVDIATSYHQQLGFSPGVLLLANFGKRKTELDTPKN
jgi:hypothetical protein